jgi:hypothetical protein
VDSTYRAATIGASQTPAKAALTSPAPGSVIRGGAATFGWTAGSGAQEYFFYAGTSVGSNNLFGQSMGLNRGVSLQGLPTSSTIYIRLWTRLTTGWQYTDYAFSATP